MPHICLTYIPSNARFAHQLSIQLQQRGLAVYPVPDPMLTKAIGPSLEALDAATHVLVVLSVQAAADPDQIPGWDPVIVNAARPVIAVLYETCEIPTPLRGIPLVDFREPPFLLAVEKLVQMLKSLGAPTRQLTVDHPIFKVDLLPSTLPSERCRRDVWLRIRYEVPMVLSIEALAANLPGFFNQTGFQEIQSDGPMIRAQRLRTFKWFDPRRAEHTLTIESREGELRATYQMIRSQAWLWMPVHYRALDREAAALYRYLATYEVGDTLEAVDRQALAAVRTSWLIVASIILTVWVIAYFIIM
jgi:hypothetical protein